LKADEEKRKEKRDKPAGSINTPTARVYAVENRFISPYPETAKNSPRTSTGAMVWVVPTREKNCAEQSTARVTTAWSFSRREGGVVVLPMVIFVCSRPLARFRPLVIFLAVGEAFVVRETLTTGEISAVDKFRLLVGSLL